MTPPHPALILLGRKWSVPILQELGRSPKGFEDLRRSLSGISPRVLSLEVTQLSTHGLVLYQPLPEARHLHGAPRTRYSLTTKGKDVLRTIGVLQDVLDNRTNVPLFNYIDAKLTSRKA